MQAAYKSVLGFKTEKCSGQYIWREKPKGCVSSKILRNGFEPIRLERSPRMTLELQIVLVFLRLLSR